MAFALDRYLNRIGIDCPSATPEGLQILQSAQMHATTFENIEPLLGRVPSLSPAAIWQKIVETGRGGYCFELNWLFGEALAATGFRARRVLARVRNGAAEGGARTHLAWKVESGGRTWLADAGFGGPGAVWPLDVGLDEPQSTPTGQYRIRIDRHVGERVLEKRVDESWFALFGFDDFPVRDIDVEVANVFCARWENSPFPSHLMMSRHRDNGRVSLFDRKFTTEKGGEIVRRDLEDAADLRARLEDDFAIACDRPRAAAIWQKIAGETSSRDRN